MRLKERFPELSLELVKIVTKGDKLKDVPLAQLGGKGLFLKEIEEALLNQQIDLAVHSMKDVPTELPPGLTLPVITHREDPRDVLISKKTLSFEDLPWGATVGTSSLRRKVQLLNLRPDLKIVPLRGNLGTRLKKLSILDLDAIVVAAAGMKRLGKEREISQYLPLDLILPGVGQGSLGIEIREGDKKVREKVKFLNHEESFWAVTAERTFLKRLGGGCQVPIAAWGEVKGERLRLKALVGSLEGKEICKGEVEGEIKEAENLGVSLAEKLLRSGAERILQNDLYRNP